MREAERGRGGEEGSGFGVQRQRGKSAASESKLQAARQTDRQTELADSIEAFHRAEQKPGTIGQLRQTFTEWGDQHERLSPAFFSQGFGNYSKVHNKFSAKCQRSKKLFN